MNDSDSDSEFNEMPTGAKGVTVSKDKNQNKTKCAKCGRVVNPQLPRKEKENGTKIKQKNYR